jgi:hypothetical protein
MTYPPLPFAAAVGSMPLNSALFEIVQWRPSGDVQYWRIVKPPGLPTEHPPK